MVVGILLLLVVAFALLLSRPEPVYQADDTPEGVIHNYLMAIRRGDYERAFGYLSQSLPGYPASVERFTMDLKMYSSIDFLDARRAQEIQPAVIEKDSAQVVVVMTTYSGLFDSDQYSETFSFRLVRSDDTWLISSSPLAWPYCWEEKAGCQ